MVILYFASSFVKLVLSLLYCFYSSNNGLLHNVMLIVTVKPHDKTKFNGIGNYTTNLNQYCRFADKDVESPQVEIYNQVRLSAASIFRHKSRLVQVEGLDLQDTSFCCITLWGACAVLTIESSATSLHNHTFFSLWLA